jgi:hypothetical protein
MVSLMSDECEHRIGQIMDANEQRGVWKTTHVRENSRGLPSLRAVIPQLIPHYKRRYSYSLLAWSYTT